MSIRKKKTMEILEEISGEKLSLGGFIRSIRLGEEISQVKFAELLEISRQRLCDIEHGRRFLDPYTADKFAKKLGYSSEQFIRLSLQDMVDKEGLKFDVDIKKSKRTISPKTKRSSSSFKYA